MKDPNGSRAVYSWSDRDLRTSEAMSFLATIGACGPFPACSQPGCGCSTTRYDEHGEAVESVDPPTHPVPADPDRPCPLHTPLLTQISLGAGGTRLYQHGPAGHLEQVTAGANVVELGGDAEGRLTALSRPAADVQAAMAYDGRSFLTRSTEFPPNPGPLFGGR